MIKFIMLTESNLHFYWEAKVACINLISLGVDPKDIIVVQTQNDNHYPLFLRDELNVNVYTYPDQRSDAAKRYPASVKPYLWIQLLQDQPQLTQYDFFYMDTDVVFRELPDFNKLPVNANSWYGSNCEAYVGVEYLQSKGKDFIAEIAPVLQLTPQEMLAYQGQGVGAQWFLTQPTISFWKDVYQECIDLYYLTTALEPMYLKQYKIEGKVNFYFYQAWTAEMTATLFNCKKHGIEPYRSTELDFDWSTDLRLNVYPFHRKIIHNSGVTKKIARDKHLFLKNDYLDCLPWTRDLSYVNQDYVSYEYVQQVLEARKWL
ncbi:MAG: hypothetical protein [Caudoviricetes sp.]|nr:MAG: hypothetical protein [Caudoviricetes sp.]